jgi:CO/xanthine dehydrogenase Mo-binding subunit
MTVSEEHLNVVGQSVLRRDGLGHVKGKTVFVDDLSFPGMLHLKMVRSPVHHGLVKGVDFSEAEKVPGFVRALTYQDVPKNIYTILCLIGVGPDDEPVLAEKRVRWKGEQIAAIVAERRSSDGSRGIRCAWISKNCPPCSMWKKRSSPAPRS